MLMATHTKTSIMADLNQVLGNFNGREYAEEIGPDTMFFADLGLASIDAVVLGETLERHYGRRLPFGEMMADLGSRTDRDISIGELCSFLERNLVAKS